MSLDIFDDLKHNIRILIPLEAQPWSKNKVNPFSITSAIRKPVVHYSNNCMLYGGTDILAVY